MTNADIEVIHDRHIQLIDFERSILEVSMNATNNQNHVKANLSAAIASQSSEHPGTLHLLQARDPMPTELSESDAVYCDAMQDYMSRHI